MKFTTKKTILFDLDGTITDSGEGIINSLIYTFKAYGINDYDDKILHKFIGPPLIESFMEIFDFDELKANEAVGVYREYFAEIGIYENKLYNGIQHLLENLILDQRKIILATSKAEVFAIRILEYFKILNYFSTIAGSELNGTRIKKGEVIRYALDKAGITDVDDVVMIGDRMHDILGAAEVGIDSIGVLYGYGNYEELHSAGATNIVESVEELHRTLLG